MSAMGPMPRFCSDDELRSVIQALGPEDALGNFKLAELKAICKRFHLKSTGDKHKLISSIASHILAANSDRNSTSSKAQKRTLEISESDREADAKRPCRDVAKHLRGIVQALGPEEALGNLTIPELKEHCKSFGLRPTGDKRSIISHIATHLLALDLEEGVQTDLASAPTKEDQPPPSPPLGSAIGDTVSTPEVTIHKLLAATEAVTRNDGLDAAHAAAERVSVPGLLSRSASEVDVETNTPIKTIYPKIERTTQLCKYQKLSQEAAVVEADAKAADALHPTVCDEEEEEAAMAAAWKQAVLCQDDTGNQVEMPRTCEEAISVAPIVPMQVEGGTGPNIDTSPTSGMQTKHDQHLHSDISNLAGHPSICEGSRGTSVIDLEKSRSVESDAAMTLAAPAELMEVDREICENVDIGSPFAMHATHAQRVPSSSTDSFNHLCVGAVESGTAMISAAVASSMQGLKLAEQPHVCEEIEETLVVDSEGLFPFEAATSSAEPSVPMHVTETGENYYFVQPSGMQAMHEHREHSGSADTLLEEEEEEGEYVYEEQKEQDEQQCERDESLDTLSDDRADKSSMMACEGGATTQASTQSLAANDDAGKPSVCEEIAETFIVQPEQVPSADSHTTCLPSALAASIEDHKETGVKCKNGAVEIQTIGFNADRVHAESAETQVEDDRNEWQEDTLREVEEGEVERPEESLDKQQETGDGELWEEEQHTLIEKAKGHEKAHSVKGQEEEEECQQQNRLQSLVCSRHGTRGGWTIDEYCSECDTIAVQLASESRLRSGPIKNEEQGEGS